MSPAPEPAAQQDQAEALARRAFETYSARIWSDQPENALTWDEITDRARDAWRLAVGVFGPYPLPKPPPAAEALERAEAERDTALAVLRELIGFYDRGDFFDCQVEAHVWERARVLVRDAEPAGEGR